MAIGDLNRRVIIQQELEARDAIGQPTVGWSDLATVWAHIRHGSGSEFIRAGSDSATVKASVRIRYRADVAIDMRVLDGAIAYNIQAILPDARKVYADLVCTVIQ